MKGLNKLGIGALALCLALALAYMFMLASAQTGLEGWVTNIEGTQPLSGVNVTVYNSTHSWSNLTDSSGYYIISTVPSGTYSVNFTLTNYLPRTHYSVTTPAYLNTSLYLDSKGSYTVTVADAVNGRPIPNASVTINWTSSSSHSGTTGPDGKLILEVPANDSVVYPNGVFHDFVVSASGYATNSSVKGQSILEGTNQNLTIYLSGSCILYGYVTDPERYGSQGINNTFIELWDSTNTARLNFSNQYFYNTTTSASGYYRINFPSTLLSGCNPFLHLSASGYDSRSVQAPGSGWNNVTLQGSAIVNGTVVDSSNTSYGIAGALVQLWKDGSVIYQKNTDSSGAFSFRVKDGEYRNSTLITKSGYNDYSNTTVYTSNISYGQIALVGTGTFSGTLADYQNTSITLGGVSVSISPTTSGAGYTTSTGPAGTFAINVSGAHAYNLNFALGGYDDNNTFTSANPAGLGTITLRGKNHITGTVTDPINMQDTTVDNVTVKVNSSSSTKSYSVTTNSAGYYSVYIPTTISPYNVIFDRVGYNVTQITSSNLNSPTINSVLTGATHVQGTARDIYNNNPVQGVVVEFIHSTNNLTYYNTTTDSSGSYSIDLGVDFNYWVRATKAGYQTFINGTAHTWDQLRNGVGDITENINLNGSTGIYIKVVDAHNGTPLDNAQICVRFDTTPPTQCEYVQTTGPGGDVSFNIEERPYRIRINRDGYLQKIIPPSGYYTGDFSQTVNLSAHAAVYVYDRYATGQAAIPYANVVVYSFNNNTNFSYTLNETVVNVTVTCNGSQMDGLNVSLVGIDHPHTSSGVTSGGTNVTLYRVPVGRINLTANGSAQGCGVHNTIINIPAGGQNYSYSYDLDVTRLRVKAVSPQGVPVQDANISSVTNPAVNCTTDSSGICTLYYMPGYTQNVSANASLYYLTNRSYDITPGVLNDKTGDPIVLNPLPGNLSVHAGNSSLQGVNVSVSNSTYKTSQLTDAAGWANFTGLTSFYNVTVNGSQIGYNWTEFPNTYIVPLNNTLINVVLGENYLYVFVTDGGPVNGSNVSLINLTSGAVAQNGYGNPLTILTNTSGEAVLHYIIPGTYNLTIEKDGFSSWNETITIGINGNSRSIVVNDTQPPQYSVLNDTSNHTSGSVYEGEVVTAYAYWTDNIELSHAWLSTNKTGSWLNETPTNLTGNASWSNFTISTAGYSGTTIGWRIYANDTSGNLNVTTQLSFAVVPDTVPPQWSSLQESPAGNVTEGEVKQFAVYWTDNIGLSQTWISFKNDSGSWVNQTPQPISGTAGWSPVFTLDTTGYGNKTVYWRIWANDTAGNVNVTNTSGFWVNDTRAPVATFVSPTPANSEVITTRDWVYINVSFNEPANTSILNWDGQNITVMNMASPTSWWYNKTGVLNRMSHNFTVYANDSFGNMGSSATRIITMNAHCNLTVEVRDGSLNPLPDINVSIRNDTIYDSKLTSDQPGDRGQARFTNLTRLVYQVTVNGTSEGYGVYQNTILPPYGESTLTVTINETRLIVNVTDVLGNPIPNAEVKLYNDSTGTGSVLLSGWTGPDGTITFDHNYPVPVCTNCNLSITKDKPFPGTHNSTLVTITPGNTTYAHLDPQPPLFTDTYTLNFTINSGDPNADGINISVRYNDSGVVVASNTTTDGSCLISNILSDRYDFVINGSIAGFSDLIISGVPIGKTLINNGTTDLNGQATVDVVGLSTYYIMVTAEGYFRYDDLENGTTRTGSYDSNYPNVNASITIALTGGTNLTGYVEDENFLAPAIGYEPVSSATLSIYTTSDCSNLDPSALRYQVTTPANGIYSIPISPRQRLSPTSNQSFCISTQAPGFVTGTDGPIGNLPFNSSHTLNIGLTGNSTVSGWVKDAMTGAAVSGANVLLLSSECYNSSGTPYPTNCQAYSATTDSNGFFTLSVNPRSAPWSPYYLPYNITITRAGYNSTTHTISSLPSVDDYYLNPAGNSWIKVNVTSTEGLNLTTSVAITLDNTPKNSSAPNCYLSGNILTCMVSDGLHNLTVDGTAVGYGINNTQFSIVVNEVRQFNIVLSPTRLNFTLMSDEGDVLSDVMVTLQGTAFQNLTDPRGIVLFSLVPAGSYNVTFSGHNISEVYFLNGSNWDILNVTTVMAGQVNNITYIFNETRALVNLTGSEIVGVDVLLTNQRTGQIFGQASTDSQLVLSLPFDELHNASNVTEDYSRFGNDGTVINATWNSTAGFNGRGVYEFDGDDYIEITDSPSLSLNDSWTITVWFKSSNLTTKDGIISKYWNYSPYASNRSYSLIIDPSDATKLHAYVSDDGTNASGHITEVSSPAGTLSENKWYFAAVVFEGGSYLKLYVNGSLVAQTTANVVNSTYDSPAPLRIGVDYTPSDSTRFFNGTIDQVTIYNRSLSAGEIRAHYLARQKAGQVFPRLPYGNYTISFNNTQLYSLGWMPTTSNISVLPGQDESTNNFTVALSDVRALFNVTNTTGSPINATNITMYFNSTPAASGYLLPLTNLTNTSGLLTFRNVIPSDYRGGNYTFDIDANASGYGIYTNNSLYVNLTGVSVLVKLNGINITIILRNQTAPLLEGVNITLYYLGGGVAQNAAGQWLNATNVTDNVTFSRLFVSNYTLEMVSDRYFSQNHTLYFDRTWNPGMVYHSSPAVYEANGTSNSSTFIFTERTLTVYVRDSNNNILTQGVNISLVNTTGGAVTGTNGSVISPATNITDNHTFQYIPDGTYAINITSDYYFNQNRTFNTTALPGMGNTMRFTMYNRSLTVYVHNSNGSLLNWQNVTVGLYNSTGLAKNTTGQDMIQNTSTGIVLFTGIPDGVYNLSVSSEGYTAQNRSIDTNNYTSPVYVYLMKTGYGYFYVTTSPSGCSVELRNGTTVIDSGTSPVKLEVNATLYNTKTLYIYVSKSGYYSSTSGPYNISEGETKNISVTLTAVPTAPSPSAGPGGGGAAPAAVCEEDWVCTAWGPCIGGIQTRNCTDRNNCGTTLNKPEESRSCVIAIQVELPAAYLNADQCVTQSITIRNTGTVDLTNLKVPSDISITNCCSLTSTRTLSILDAGQTGTIPLRICAPKTAVKGDYQTELDITSDQIDKSITAYIYVTKEYGEVLVDRADNIREQLVQLDTSQFDAVQAGWYQEALAAIEDAKAHAAQGNFEAAEAALQLAQANLAKIKEYVAPVDLWWLVPLVPIFLVAAGLGIWWFRFRKPGYVYRPPREYPIRYDKKALLNELESLNKKVAGIDGKRLGLTDRYYFDKARNALNNVKEHIMKDNLVAAKRTLSEAETYLKVLESRLLSFNLLKTVQD